MMDKPRTLHAHVAVSVATEERRESGRVPGPFDAWRVGILETPVRIYDISLGGCFVHAMHEQERGVVVMLKIQLPEAGLGRAEGRNALPAARIRFWRAIHRYAAGDAGLSGAGAADAERVSRRGGGLQRPLSDRSAESTVRFDRTSRRSEPASRSGTTVT